MIRKRHEIIRTANCTASSTRRTHLIPVRRGLARAAERAEHASTHAAVPRGIVHEQHMQTQVRWRRFGATEHRRLLSGAHNRAVRRRRHDDARGRRRRAALRFDRGARKPAPQPLLRDDRDSQRRVVRIRAWQHTRRRRRVRLGARTRRHEFGLLY